MYNYSHTLYSWSMLVHNHLSQFYIASLVWLFPVHVAGCFSSVSQTSIIIWVPYLEFEAIFLLWKIHTMLIYIQIKNNGVGSLLHLVRHIPHLGSSTLNKTSAHVLQNACPHSMQYCTWLIKQTLQRNMTAIVSLLNSVARIAGTQPRKIIIRYVSCNNVYIKIMIISFLFNIVWCWMERILAKAILWYLLNLFILTMHNVSNCWRVISQLSK